MKVKGLESLYLRRKSQRIQFLSLLLANKQAVDPNEYLSPLPTRQTLHAKPHSLTPHCARTVAFLRIPFSRGITQSSRVEHAQNARIEQHV